MLSVTEPRDHPISVPASRLGPLLDQARGAGIDLDGLSRGLDLKVRLDALPEESSISLADYYRIQNRLMILIGDETLHMSARQLLPGSTDFVLRNVSECKNLTDVMQVIAKTYNLLHGGEYNAVARRADTIDYLIDDRKFPYTDENTDEFIYFSIECILIFLHCMLMTVSNRADTAVKGLNIRRPWPGSDCGHLGYWDAPIKFGADVYCVSFSRALAEAPIVVPPLQARSSNAVYQKIVEAVAGKHARHGGVQSMTARVRDSLERGVIEQGEIAAQIGVSVATLRRRLAREGTGFRDLRRDVLNDTAKRLLAEQRSVSEVSDALGFSEFRAFNRAFKDWNGVTPKAYVRGLEA
ncbi:helix-turn-helix domain-containing protein [Hyphococcus sp.]|uniref:helix-turn-helix domain-containing protein n=1 Tax=Hyphococcus sp. TaxID=2038636 RepID=UPI003D0ED9E9